MSLAHGVLGFLNYGSMSGYDLAKAFSSSVQFFWNAQNSQIYLVLNKLEKQGFAQTQSADTEIVDIYKLNIRECLGCFACWSKTPGKCAITDDMTDVLQKILRADVMVWSFPLYYL